MRAVFTHPDGGLSVIVPSPNKLARLMAEGLTEQQAMERIAQKATGRLPFRLIDESQLPGRDEYRDAWRDNGTTIDFDLTKARQIKRDLLNLEIDEPAGLLDQLRDRIEAAEDSGNSAEAGRLRDVRRRLRESKSQAVTGDTLDAIRTFRPSVMDKR